MATLYITEYQGTGLQPNQSIQSPMEPPLATQALTYTGTAGVSAAFSAKTQLVRITSEAVCSYLFSSAGTAATTSSPRLAAGVSEYHAVPLGQGFKVSAITNT